MIYPPHIWLLSQRIDVDEVVGLTCPPESGPVMADENGEPHVHRAYGVYSEEHQRIEMDAGLCFERQRETFLHENLHAMISVTQLDTLMNAAMDSFDEHLVSVLAPVMLAWLRDNPDAIAFLMETQPCASI